MKKISLFITLLTCSITPLYSMDNRPENEAIEESTNGKQPTNFGWEIVPPTNENVDNTDAKNTSTENKTEEPKSENLPKSGWEIEEQKC
jgi:hypothetical protein